MTEIRFRTKNSISGKIIKHLLLKQKPKSVQQISDALQLEHITVIRSLRRLKKQGIVGAVKARTLNISAHGQMLLYFLSKHNDDYQAPERTGEVSVVRSDGG